MNRYRCQYLHLLIQLSHVVAHNDRIYAIAYISTFAAPINLDLFPRFSFRSSIYFLRSLLSTNSHRIQKKEAPKGLTKINSKLEARSQQPTTPPQYSPRRSTALLSRRSPCTWRGISMRRRR